jgi:prophage tail gpP-like protein
MSTAELKIEIGGQEITPLSATIRKTMDTGVDSWAAPVAWTPGLDPALDKIALPFTYPKARVFIDNELQITGYMYNPQPSLRTDGQRLDFVGASKTADAIDSTAKPPYFSKDADLKTRASDLLSPLSLKAEFEADAGGPFPDGMTIGPTERIFSHLLKYASQRGILIANTPRGNMLFWKAITSGEPVASITENPDFSAATSATEYAASYDGRLLYSTYRAIRDTPDTSDALKAIFGSFGDEPIKNAISTDTNIPKSRFLTLRADETTGGDLQKAVDWARSAIYAEALTQTINVPGWRIPGKKESAVSVPSVSDLFSAASGGSTSPIWEVNTLVSVTSPTLMLPNGYIFLIKEVEFLLDNGAQSTNLSLVPPQVYSGDPIDYPWSTPGGDSGLSGLVGMAADLLGF